MRYIITGRSSGLFYAECLPVDLAFTSINSGVGIQQPQIGNRPIREELTATGIAPDLHRFPF